ncbi:MAG: hypothetical protein ACJAVI_002572 [Candidatus Azotimanducaceae bacterium]|jgi:hypothetical protein
MEDIKFTVMMETAINYATTSGVTIPSLGCSCHRAMNYRQN